ncbi:hypothetical protein AYI68_g1189 [Smittium mucronatum]|uniref:Uncharacterized protein n=1 Tax=Smittium mucronatum TaxID=133383 RepID=A0A1R0H6D0_9FUNG|nr:hypothetical protein AYI68_g1189 [Smittium mucronatum]
MKVRIEERKSAHEYNGDFRYFNKRILLGIDSDWWTGSAVKFEVVVWNKTFKYSSLLSKYIERCNMCVDDEIDGNRWQLL